MNYIDVSSGKTILARKGPITIFVAMANILECILGAALKFSCSLEGEIREK